MKTTYYAIAEDAKVKEHIIESEDEIDLQEALVDVEAEYYKAGVSVILIPKQDLNTIITEIFKLKDVKLCQCDNCSCGGSFFKFF